MHWLMKIRRLDFFFSRYSSPPGIESNLHLMELMCLYLLPFRGLTLEKEIFPAGTDSRFLREVISNHTEVDNDQLDLFFGSHYVHINLN